MNATIRLSLAAAALGAASFSSQAADVTVRLTGSTAFRAAVYRTLTTNFFDVAPVRVPASATDATGVVTFVGTNTALFGATTRVIIETAYSGSVEGLINVLRTSASSPVSQPTFLLPGGGNDPIKQADLALSDVAQNTTTFPASQKGAAPEFQADSVNFAGQGVGVVTFAFVKNRGTSTNILQNITSDQFKALAANGTLSQGFFTSDVNNTTPVYLAGRYSFSGTRLTVGADTGLGANAFQSLYAGSASDFMNGATMRIVPAASFNNNYNNGFVSGGRLARLLNNTAMTDKVVGYLGLGDVRSATDALNGTVLTPLSNYVLNFNGVAPTRDNVLNGSYTFWAYEHLYGDINGVTANVTTFVNGNSDPTPITSNGFIAQLDAVLKTDHDYVALDEMLSSRSGDGGVVVPLF